MLQWVAGDQDVKEQRKTAHDLQQAWHVTVSADVGLHLQARIQVCVDAQHQHRQALAGDASEGRLLLQCSQRQDT